MIAILSSKKKTKEASYLLASFNFQRSRIPSRRGASVGEFRVGFESKWSNIYHKKKKLGNSDQLYKEGVSEGDKLLCI